MSHDVAKLFFGEVIARAQQPPGNELGILQRRRHVRRAEASLKTFKPSGTSQRHPIAQDAGARWSAVADVSTVESHTLLPLPSESKARRAESAERAEDLTKRRVLETIGTALASPESVAYIRRRLAERLGLLSRDAAT